MPGYSLFLNNSANVGSQKKNYPISGKLGLGAKPD